MKKGLGVLLLQLFFTLASSAQENFSIATGVSLLRNFSPQQQFLVVGHTVQAQVHFSPRQSAYAWLEYYTDGTFENNFTVNAKVPFIVLPQRSFSATGRFSYRHFSLGWKHYFSGSYAEEKTVSVYGLAGFGFLFARVQNELMPAIDTFLYAVPVAAGDGRVHKLTFDLGLGAELPLKSGLNLFTDLRTSLPASSNPSPYLHNQRNVSLPLLLTAGLRVLIWSER